MRPSKLEALKVIGFQNPKIQSSFTQKDAVIYALSLGFGQDIQKEDELKYVYEKHPNFSIFPTFCPTVSDSMHNANFFTCPHVPMVQNPIVLNREQRVQFYNPKLESGTKYQTSCKICDVFDTGKSIRMGFQHKTKNQKTGQLCFIMYIKAQVFGIKGDGYKGNGYITQLPKKPSQEPTSVINFKISDNQHLLYRLNGYPHALYVDPVFARKYKYDRAIMLGVASLQLCVKTVVQKMWGGNQDMLKAYQGRFLGIVYPGQRIQLKIWRKQNVEIFEARVNERNKAVLYGIVERKAVQKL